MSSRATPPPSDPATGSTLFHVPGGLAEFLRARVDEDAQRAGQIHDAHCGYILGSDALPVSAWCDCGEPPRASAEVKAKRLIIEDFEAYSAAPDRLTNPGTLLYWMALRHVLYHLAEVYRDHPDYAAAIEAMRATV